MSHNLTAVLVCFYAVIMATNIYEGNWPKAMYWLSAGMIVISVELMK
jgi:hypothetical protein